MLILKSLLLAIHAYKTSYNAFLYADFIYSDISMLKEGRKKHSNLELTLLSNSKKMPSFSLHEFLSLYHLWKLQIFIFHPTKSHHDSAAAGTEHFCACNGVRGTPRESRIVGECWTCTWDAQRESLSQSQGQLFAGRTVILAAKSAHRNVFLESKMAESLLSKPRTATDYGTRWSSTVKCKLLREI